jgi:hypothetical protein
MAGSLVHRVNEWGDRGSASEDTVPERGRWWTEATERFVEGKCRVSERWRRRMRHILWSIPSALERAGRPVPASPRAVCAADIRALKEASGWAPSTLQTNLLVLRAHPNTTDVDGFQWNGSPIGSQPP